MSETSELALPFGKYHGWLLSGRRQRSELLSVAIEATLCAARVSGAPHSLGRPCPSEGAHPRLVRVERRTLGSCELYTFPAERIVRQRA
jgi:hypothetical protein